MPKGENRKTITDAVIKSMKPGDVVYDTTVRGFCVRFRGHDHQFLLRTRIHGRERWLTIGAYGSPWTCKTARDEALSLLGIIADGGDPATERERERDLKTLKEVAELFLKDHCGVDDLSKKKCVPRPGAKVKPGTALGYRVLLRDYVLPKLGKHRITSVTKSDIEELHKAMSKTPRAANHMLSCVSKLYSWAHPKYWPSAENPARKIGRYEEKGRTRHLSDDETKRLVEAINAAEAAEKISVHSAYALRFLLLTGLRPREALNLKWTDIDLSGGIAYLRDTKTGDRTATLTTYARELLTAVPKVEGNEHVFCGVKSGTSLSSLQHPFETVRAMAKLSDGLVLYSLRHSHATVLANSGMQAWQLMQAMGHKHLATSMRYIHAASEGTRAAADKATAGVGGLVVPTKSDAPGADVIAYSAVKNR